MVGSNKSDPLDPLEAAYSGTDTNDDSGGIGGNAGAVEAGQDPNFAGGEVFHGEPVEEDADGFDPGSDIPPPPLQSPGQRILSLLPFVAGLAILVTLIFFGYRFITSRGGSSGSTELTYWILWEEEATIKALAEEYQKENSEVKINVVRQSPIEYRERLQAHISSGQGPDIFRFHNTWVPMLRGELAPVPGDLLSGEEFSNVYYPVAVEDLKVGESILGIPLMYDGLVVFYNVDILQAAGYDNPSDNWNDFLVQAARLTVKDQSGQIITSGAALGRADNITHFSDILGLLFLQNGANPARPGGETGSGALDFYRLFAQVPDNVWGAEFGDDITAFAGGKAAMIFAPSWQVFTIQAINPDLNFAVASVPQVTGGSQDVYWATYWVEGVNNKSANQKEAWGFVKFFSEKENLEKLYALESQTRVFGEPYPRKDMADMLSDSKYLSPLLKGAENSQSFYMASRTFDNGLNDRVIQYYRDAVNSLDQGVGSQEALNTASQGISQVLSSFGVTVE